MNSEDAIAVMIIRYLIPVTGLCETVKLTPSSIGEPSAKVLE